MRLPLAITSYFSDVPLKLRERNIFNKHDRLKYPNWWESDQLAFYKHDRRVELGSTEKQLQLSGESGAWNPQPHSATLLSHLLASDSLEYKYSVLNQSLKASLSIITRLIP